MEPSGGAEFEELLAAGAGIVSLRGLAAAGWDRAGQRALVRRCGLIRVRPGWYRVEGAPEQAVRAVAAGGACTCVDALVLRGAWRPPGASAPHARFARWRDAGAGVVAHVAPAPGVPVVAAIDPAPLAASCLARCLGGEAAVAVLDSVLRQGIVEAHDLAAALRAAGKAGLRLASRVDPSAESGIESLLRMLLRGAHIGYRAQVRIWGAGRVDFLVGDRLVIEADGLAHHVGAQVQGDRDRDHALEQLGFHVLRFTYDDIVRRPDHVLATIRAVLGRREHRWSRRNCAWRRAGLQDPVVGEEVPAVVGTWAVARARLRNGSHGADDAYGASSAAPRPIRTGGARTPAA